MRVLHVPFGYFPDAVGGTEVYVADLCQSLERFEVTSIVAAPGSMVSRTVHAGVEVRRFPVGNATTPDEMYGLGDESAAKAFGELLEDVVPDIVHFHAFSPAISVKLLREVKKRGMPCIFTYHTPTGTCLRGTLLRWGSVHCDGEMRPGRCSVCLLNGLGVPKIGSVVGAALSVFLSPFPLRGGLKLRAVPLVKQWIAASREWLTGMDRVIALGQWGRKLLLLNGVPAERLRIIRHGVPSNEHSKSSPRDREVLRLAFFGRADRTKGLETLLQSLRLIQTENIELRIHAIIEENGEAYARLMRELIAQDARVSLLAPLPRAEVVQAMTNADAVVVPSLWFETGPLVVLESFSAGVPVIGSAWGGIVEWVTHEQDGLLVSQPTPVAWAQAIKRLIQEPELLAKLTAGVRPPRSVDQVGQEVYAVYQELLNPKTAVR